MMEPEIIQRFLESVGQKADVDLYLKHFRAQRKESFAIIAADAQIVRTALDPFHFDLRILAGLGLYPVVLLGLFVLMLVHSAHRFRYTLYDGLQVKKKRTVAVLCYGVAIAGSVAALAVLWAV